MTMFTLVLNGIFMHQNEPNYETKLQGPTMVTVVPHEY